MRAGLIVPAIAERQLVRSGAGGTRQRLVTEADAHDGLSAIKQLLDLLHSALARGRSPGPFDRETPSQSERKPFENFYQCLAAYSQPQSRCRVARR